MFNCGFFIISGSYSRVTMQLVLTRKITYHLFRTYLPSGLFVVIGWFSLFIPLDHVPGRVTMGMTTLLTLAAMFSAIATTTPRVSYSSKLDVWMVFCVIFVFGTLLEFTLLIFLQKQVFATRLKRSFTNTSFKINNHRTSESGLSGLSLGGMGSAGGGIGSSSMGRGMGSQHTQVGHICRGSASSNTFIPDSAGNTGSSHNMYHHQRGGSTSSSTYVDATGTGHTCRTSSNAFIDAAAEAAAAASAANNGGESRMMLTTLNVCRPDGGHGGSGSGGGGGGRRRRFDPLGCNSNSSKTHVTLHPFPSGSISNHHSHHTHQVLRDTSTDTMDRLAAAAAAGASEGDLEALQAEEERQREIIFRIERYGIVAFAVFFVVFNVFYWLHLLRSKLF